MIRIIYAEGVSPNQGGGIPEAMELGFAFRTITAEHANDIEINVTEAPEEAKPKVEGVFPNNTVTQVEDAEVLTFEIGVK